MNPGLEITIEVFVRVELRRIRGQKEDFDLICMLFQPGFDSMAAMNFKVIEDKKYLPAGRLYQTPHEFDQLAGIHFLPVNVNGQCYRANP